MRSAYNFFVAGVYASNCSFASLGSFFKFFKKDLLSRNYNKEQTIKYLKEIESSLSTTDKIDQKKAQELLIARDLNKVIKFLENNNLQTPEEILKEHYNKYNLLLKKYKLSKWTMPYYVVDSLPKPYNKMAWSSAYFELLEKYNIKDGIYIFTSYMYEFTISGNISHELIHSSISSNSTIE